MREFATAKEIRAYLGTGNWVLHRRRTQRIIDRYGEGVLCLSDRQYHEMVRRILLARTEGFD